MNISEIFLNPHIAINNTQVQLGIPCIPWFIF